MGDLREVCINERFVEHLRWDYLLPKQATARLRADLFVLLCGLRRVF